MPLVCLIGQEHGDTAPWLQTRAGSVIRARLIHSSFDPPSLSRQEPTGDLGLKTARPADSNYLFSWTRVKIPNASFAKPSALPSSPIINVVIEGT
jgi:hypothetical protein